MKKRLIVSVLALAAAVTCGVFLILGLTVWNHKHDYTQEVVKQEYLASEATCTEKATYYYSCSCGEKGTETFTYGEVNPHNHAGETELKNAVSATCGEAGYTGDVYCTACDALMVNGTATEKLSHTPGEWIVTKTATCTEAGSRYKVCTLCGTTITTEEITKLAHTEVTDKAVAATCTATGLTEGSHCSVCGDVITAQTVTEKIAHTESDWIVTKASTCSEEGSQHKVCKLCGTETETETIDKLAHTVVVDKAVAATCTATGLAEGSHCSVCNEVIVAQTATDKVSHTYSDWVTAKEATCTEAGSRYKVCTVCKTDTVTETIRTISHTSSDWIVTKTATCTEAGSRYKVCTLCGTTITTEEITKLAHTEVTDKAVAATCTATGLTEGSHCSVCNTVITAQETVPMTAHDYTAATCTTAATCKVCGTANGTVNSENHKWSEWTSVGDGTHTRECVYDAAHTEKENCSGGTATCMSSAKCATCGGYYGAADPTNHTGEKTWTKNENQHRYYYTCCNASESGWQDHSFTDGVCTKRNGPAATRLPKQRRSTALTAACARSAATGATIRAARRTATSRRCARTAITATAN